MKILQVVPYSIDKPRHGGQIRCARIYEKLVQLGHSVTLLTVSDGEISSIGKTLTFPLRKPYSGAINEIPILEAGPYLSSATGQHDLESILGNEDFDLVWVDQPFVFKPVYEHFKRNAERPYFVYSSQNIEAEMYAEIFKDHLGELETANLLRIIAQQEEFAASNSNCIVSVTSDDARKLSELAGGIRVINIPNASDGLQATGDSLNRVREMFGEVEFAFFVASAHEPNIRGFEAILGLSLEYFPPKNKLVIAGSVGRALLERAKKAGTAEPFLSRTVILEDVDSEDLHALRQLAKVTLLPILSGGGSNLKTAEALLNPGQIIGTSLSFRGFEDWSRAPGVFIFDEAHDFRKSMIGALSGQSMYLDRQTHANSNRQPLTWADAMQNIGKVLEEVANHDLG